MVPILLSEYLGVERISSSVGLSRLFQAVGNLAGPMVAGLLMDKVSVAASFYFMGGVVTLGAVPFLAQPLLQARARNKEEITTGLDFYNKQEE